MVSGKILLLAVLIAGVAKTRSAAVPFLELRMSGAAAGVPAEREASAEESPEMPPPAVARVRVAEGAPALLCAGLCNARPPAAIARGPVCAFNAVGTARTFATLCELEAASCRDSTFYAIASIGEC